MCILWPKREWAVFGLLLLVWKAETSFTFTTLAPWHRRYFYCDYPQRQRRFASNKTSALAARNEHDRASSNAVDEVQGEKTVVIAYHKPPNVITSHSNADLTSSDDSARRTVYEDICSMKGFVSDRLQLYSNRENFADATQIYSKLHAIGRLDADTTGLLLLTNDGALVHRITNPNAKSGDGGNALNAKPVPKTYEAVIMGHHSLPLPTTMLSTQQPATAEDYPLQTLVSHGVTLSAKHGCQTKPVDDLTILSYPTRTTTKVSITISEGKNRQIRRMFHAVGSGVIKLHRVGVGGFSLRGLADDSNEGDKEFQTIDLDEGQWRLLTETEIERGLGWKCRYLNADDSTRKYLKGTSRRNKHRLRRKRRKDHGYGKT